MIGYLDRLKNLNIPHSATDKTDKSGPNLPSVSSVSSVSSGGSEIFFIKDSPDSSPSVSFVSAPPGEFVDFSAVRRDDCRHAKPALASDPFATVRAVKKMRAAGFALSLDDGRLMVEPLSRLSEQQRAYLRSHKAALVGLLMDAETLAAALAKAGAAGLAWREGTPGDWSDDRLLAAGEALYADGRMAKRHERRYGPASAPAFEEGPECPLIAESPQRAFCAAVAPSANVAPMDREAHEERAAIMERDGGLPRGEADPLGHRIAELIAAGWSPWNAEARARSEALPGWEDRP